MVFHIRDEQERHLKLHFSCILKAVRHGRLSFSVLLFLVEDDASKNGLGYMLTEAYLNFKSYLSSLCRGLASNHSCFSTITMLPKCFLGLTVAI